MPRAKTARGSPPSRLQKPGRAKNKIYTAVPFVALSENLPHVSQHNYVQNRLAKSYAPKSDVEKSFQRNVVVPNSPHSCDTILNVIPSSVEYQSSQSGDEYYPDDYCDVHYGDVYHHSEHHDYIFQEGMSEIDVIQCLNAVPGDEVARANSILRSSHSESYIASVLSTPPCTSSTPLQRNIESKNLHGKNQSQLVGGECVERFVTVNRYTTLPRLRSTRIKNMRRVRRQLYTHPQRCSQRITRKRKLGEGTVESELHPSEAHLASFNQCPNGTGRVCNVNIPSEAESSTVSETGVKKKRNRGILRDFPDGNGPAGWIPCGRLSDVAHRGTGETCIKWAIDTPQGRKMLKFHQRNDLGHASAMCQHCNVAYSKKNLKAHEDRCRTLLPNRIT